MRYLKRLLEFDATVALIIGILVYGWMPIIDPDFFWHVKNGERILFHGGLLTHEEFSHTAGGAPITVPGWLFGPVIYLTWEYVGDFGVLTLVMVFLVLTWFVMLKAVGLFIERREVATLLSLLGMLLLSPVFAPRPNLFTHFGFAATLYLALHFARHRRTMPFALLIPLYALWPNVHWGFPTSMLLLLLLLAAACLDRLLPLSDDRPLAALLSGRFLLITGIALLALGLNPYGYAIFPELLQMTDRARDSFVTEWRSPSFKSFDELIFLATIALYCGLLYLAHGGKSWAMIIVPGAIIAAFMNSVRNLGFWAPTFVVFLAALLPRTEVVTWFARRPVHGFWRGEPANDTSRLIHAGAIAVCIATLVTASPVIRGGWRDQAATMLPVAATEFMLENLPDGKLFNRYAGGGYLIWRTFPRFPVFIDGRFTPYSEQTTQDYWTMANALPGATSLIDRYALEIFLVATASAIAELLAQADSYRLVYVDGNYSIYVIDSEKFRHIPAVTP